MLTILRHWLNYGTPVSGGGGEPGEADGFEADVIAYGPTGELDPIYNLEFATLALANQTGTGPVSVRFRQEDGGEWITALSEDDPDFVSQTIEVLQGPDEYVIEAVCTFSDDSEKIIPGIIEVLENTAPYVATPIGDVSATEGDSDIVIDLDDHFMDDEGGTVGLSYSFVGGAPASALLTGIRSNVLTISCVDAVEETIIVRATDHALLTGDESFDVVIEASASWPAPPAGFEEAFRLEMNEGTGFPADTSGNGVLMEESGSSFQWSTVDGHTCIEFVGNLGHNLEILGFPVTGPVGVRFRFVRTDADMSGHNWLRSFGGGDRFLLRFERWEPGVNVNILFLQDGTDFPQAYWGHESLRYDDNEIIDCLTYIDASGDFHCIFYDPDDRTTVLQSESITDQTGGYDAGSTDRMQISCDPNRSFKLIDLTVYQAV